jgi:CcmD family protein
MPALPLHEAGKYVAAAYVIFFALILIYVAVMAVRLSHIERELGDLIETVSQPKGGSDAAGSATALAQPSSLGVSP